jgi:hypothetical protein
MSSTYTPLLGLVIPTTGELTGTWGDILSDNLTKYVEASIAGFLVVGGSVTLNTTMDMPLGATSSQYAILIASGHTANITITVPATSKTYVVINTSPTFTVTVRGTGPTTGATLAAGERALVAWVSTDFVKVAQLGGSVSFTSVTATTFTGNLVGNAQTATTALTADTATMATTATTATNLSGGSVNGTTGTFSGAVSGLSFSGAGTGLTGTANALSIGGNAATATYALTSGATENATNAVNAQFAVTQPLTDNSTKIATTAFAMGLAFQAALPDVDGTVAGYVPTNDGTNSFWSPLKTIDGQSLLGAGDVILPKPEVSNAKAFFFSSF